MFPNSAGTHSVLCHDAHSKSTFHSSEDFEIFHSQGNSVLSCLSAYLPLWLATTTQTQVQTLRFQGASWWLSRANRISSTLFFSYFLKQNLNIFYRVLQIPKNMHVTNFKAKWLGSSMGMREEAIATLRPPLWLPLMLHPTPSETTKPKRKAEGEATEEKVQGKDEPHRGWASFHAS